MAEDRYYTHTMEKRDKNSLRAAQDLIYRARALLFRVADRGLADPTRTQTVRRIAVRLAEPFNNLTKLIDDLAPLFTETAAAAATIRALDEYADVHCLTKEETQAAWEASRRALGHGELSPEAAAEAESAAESGRPDESVQFSDIAAPGPDGTWT